MGDAEVGSLNAVQKLVKVESRLVELSDLIESIPKENVEAIERIKRKERRQKYGSSLLSIDNGLGGCFCNPPQPPYPHQQPLHGKHCNWGCRANSRPPPQRIVLRNECYC